MYCKLQGFSGANFYSNIRNRNRSCPQGMNRLGSGPEPDLNCCYILSDQLLSQRSLVHYERDGSFEPNQCTICLFGQSLLNARHSSSYTPYISSRFRLLTECARQRMARRRVARACRSRAPLLPRALHLAARPAAREGPARGRRNRMRPLWRTRRRRPSGGEAGAVVCARAAARALCALSRRQGADERSRSEARMRVRRGGGPGGVSGGDRISPVAPDALLVH